MIFTGILVSVVLFANVLYGVDSSCDSYELDKCADVVKFLSSRENEIVGPKMLREVCSFINKNVTTCADGVVTRCPNLKDERYKTFLRVKSKVQEEICKSESNFENVLIKHQSCLNTISENKAIECVQDLLVATQMLKDAEDKEICCAVSSANTCIYNLILSKCDAEAANTTIEVTSLLLSPLTELRCGAFDYKKCKRESGSGSWSLSSAGLLLFTVVSYWFITTH